jgi:hypothetical protein
VVVLTISTLLYRVIRLRCHIPYDVLCSLLRCDHHVCLSCATAPTWPSGWTACKPSTYPTRTFFLLIFKLLRDMYINFLYTTVYFSNISNGSLCTLSINFSTLQDCDHNDFQQFDGTSHLKHCFSYSGTSIEGFPHLMFNSSDPKSITSVNFPQFKIFLSLVFKSTLLKGTWNGGFTVFTFFGVQLNLIFWLYYKFLINVNQHKIKEHWFYITTAFSDVFKTELLIRNWNILSLMSTNFHSRISLPRTFSFSYIDIVRSKYGHCHCIYVEVLTSIYVFRSLLLQGFCFLKEKCDKFVCMYNEKLFVNYVN